MRVGPFITCFNDTLFPGTGRATEEMLERLGHEAAFPEAQTCCGQMHFNTGYQREAIPLVRRFVEIFEPYDATVHRVDEADLPGRIWEILEKRGLKRLVVPPLLPEAWIPEGVEVLRNAARPRLTNEELDGADGVLTGCALGISQTGTIVLDVGPAQGRRALTLLPDYHLCVVREDQIVGLVSEAFARLEETVRDEGWAVTFISGPSATSDIELNRVESAHGPRALEVLIVG